MRRWMKEMFEALMKRLIWPLLTKIAQELLAEDEGVKTTLREQVRTMLLKQIQEAKTLRDLNPATSDASGLLTAKSVEAVAQDVIDHELRDALRARAVEVIIETMATPITKLNVQDFFGPGDFTDRLRVMGLPTLLQQIGKDTLADDLEVRAAINTRAKQAIIQIVQGLSEVAFLDAEALGLAGVLQNASKAALTGDEAVLAAIQEKGQRAVIDALQDLDAGPPVDRTDWDLLKQALSVSALLLAVLQKPEVQGALAVEIRTALEQAFPKTKPPAAAEE
ncbi:MAG: hypothetical protein WC516_03850 [Patescibacteria group bacterium]